MEIPRFRKNSRLADCGIFHGFSKHFHFASHVRIHGDDFLFLVFLFHRHTFVFAFVFQRGIRLPERVRFAQVVRGFLHFFRYDVAAFFGRKKQRTTLFEKMMLVLFLLIVADIAQFALNISSHAVFSVESFYSDGGFFAPDIYYRIVSYFPYDVHLSLSYILVLMTLVCLVKKTILSPSLYRIKYWDFLIMISIVVIINSFYVMFELPVDFSVIFYGLVCVSIYYFSFNYIPKYLQRKSIACVIEDMDSGILIFDIDDRCIFINDHIRRLCEISANQDPEIAVRPFVNKFANARTFSEREPYEEIRCLKVKEKTVYYRVAFSRIEAKDGKFLGSYFLLIDVSEERNREKQEQFRNNHDQIHRALQQRIFLQQSRRNS